MEVLVVQERRAAYNMHVYVILAEEHKLICFIFNHHQQVYEALVFQIPVLHKHVQRCASLSKNFSLLRLLPFALFITHNTQIEQQHDKSI